MTDTWHYCFRSLSLYQATGNFPTVTRVLLSKIPANQDGRMSYSYDDYMFHYQVSNGICYLLLSDAQGKHRIPYACLDDIQQRFVAEFGIEAPLTAHAFSYNDAFEPTLKQVVDFFNSDQADESHVDQIGLVKSQMSSVKETMVQNIESVLERGEKIELLVDKTDRLNAQAFDFQVSRFNF